LKQCLRWARSNWRSNFKSLFLEGSVWRRHPWSTFAVFQPTLTSWAFVYDFTMLYLVWHLTASLRPEARQIVRIICLVWIVFISRLVKYIEHFSRFPQDVKYIFLIPLFGYFHSLVIKVYAMVTMHVTTWGSREGADANDNYRMIRLPSYMDMLVGSSNSKSTTAEIDDMDETFGDDHQPLLPKYGDDA